jgi:hypothetical protein
MFGGEPMTCVVVVDAESIDVALHTVPSLKEFQLRVWKELEMFR